MTRRVDQTARRGRPVTHAEVIRAINREIVPVIDKAIRVLNQKQDVAGGPTSGRPSNPDDYEMYYDTTLNYPVWWDGNSWEPAYAPPDREYGCMYWTNNSPGATTVNVWRTASGITGLVGAEGFSMPSSNQLQKTSSGTSLFAVDVHANMTCSVAANDVELGVMVNGVAPTADAWNGHVTVGLPADRPPMSCGTVVSLSQGDYVSVGVRNISFGNPTGVYPCNVKVVQL